MNRSYYNSTARSRGLQRIRSSTGLWACRLSQPSREAQAAGPEFCSTHSHKKGHLIAVSSYGAFFVSAAHKFTLPMCVSPRTSRMLTPTWMGVSGDGGTPLNNQRPFGSSIEEVRTADEEELRNRDPCGLVGGHLRGSLRMWNYGFLKEHHWQLGTALNFSLL